MAQEPEKPAQQNTPNPRRDSGFSPVPGGRGGSSSTQGRLPDVTDRLVARKSRPRIKGFNYRGEYAYHVTIRTANSRKVFEDIALGASVIALLESSAEACHFEFPAYCLMPDHLHLLAKGRDDEADLRKLVSLFKQRSGFLYKGRAQRPLWQTSYFDRALRREDDLQTVADYVFSNPVKAGLAVDASSYPLSGGLYFGDRGLDAMRSRGRKPEATGDRAEAAVPTNVGGQIQPEQSTGTEP